MPLLLSAEESVLEGVLILHVLANLISEDLYLIIALSALAFHFIELSLELCEKLVDLLLLIAESDLFKSLISYVLRSNHFDLHLLYIFKYSYVYAFFFCSLSDAAEDEASIASDRDDAPLGDLM